MKTADINALCAVPAEKILEHRAQLGSRGNSNQKRFLGNENCFQFKLSGK
jgi:hypothetical protein